MTKYTIHSTNESALSLTDNSKLTLNNRANTFSKGSFFQIFSEMSQYFYNFNKSKQSKPSTVVSLELPAKETSKEKSLQLSEITEAAAKLRISVTILKRIMSKLESFELENGYLDKELTLNSLAKSFGTNHSYLSKIVRLTKNKPFKSYLNDLRIEYAYNDLKNNTTKRRFTIEAIAFDNGFRSAESFSKKFKAKYEVYPSKFLKSLEG